MISIKNAALLSIAALGQISSSTPATPDEVLAPELVERNGPLNHIKVWPGPNYTGTPKTFNFIHINDCAQPQWQTIGSIWLPPNLVCTFVVEPSCTNTTGNFWSPTIYPPGLADIRQWIDERKKDFPAYWFNNARSIQCGGSHFSDFLH